MIRKSFIELTFEAASIERWNDHIRPSRGFTELDKQAHKMLYAYVLGKMTKGIDWLKLIEGGIFSFLQRLLMTDIKPPIFHRLMDEKGEQINRWVLSSLKGHIDAVPNGFYRKMEQYLLDESYAAREKEVLEAAHYLATKWEFDIIYGMCGSYYGIEDTKREIDGKLDSFQEIEGFHKFRKDQNLIGFTNLMGELRFQQRWSRVTRMPATSVMGHTFVVALLSYLCSCEINACPARTVNNFLGGLFHDMPEVLTRDIVSPVKNSVEGLDAIIKQIEDSQMNDVIYPLIPAEWQEQLNYFTQDEFSSKIIRDGLVMKCSSDEISAHYNEERFSPVDGEIIRGCDHLSAYLETYMSHSSGVNSRTMTEANQELYEQYRNVKIGGVDFGVLFDYFKF